MSGTFSDWLLRAAQVRTSAPEIDAAAAFHFEGEPSPPLYTSQVNGGRQAVYRFPNGLGASVVQHSFSYGQEQGLWELAVIRFDGEASDKWHITYDTPVTDDVLGRLSEEDVVAALAAIEKLPAPEATP